MMTCHVMSNTIFYELQAAYIIDVMPSFYGGLAGEVIAKYSSGTPKIEPALQVIDT